MDKFVKPAYEGLIVRYPGTKVILPVNGGWVPWTGKDGRYWRRRMKDGSIIECVQSKKIFKPEIKHTLKKREIK